MIARYKIFRYFILTYIMCFSILLGDEAQKEEDYEKSFLFTKNIALESNYIDVAIKDCTLSLKYKKYKKCKNDNFFQYYINDKMKNNILLWLYTEFMGSKHPIIFLKKNGTRLTQDSKTYNIYNSNMKLALDNYDNYDGYNDSVDKFLRINQAHIVKTLRLYAKKENKNINKIINKSFAFSVYLDEIKGNIEIEKTKSNSNIYSVNISLDIKTKLITHKLNINNNYNNIAYEKSNTLDTKIVKTLLLNFKKKPTNKEFEYIIFQAMKFGFRESSKKLKSKFKKTKHKANMGKVNYIMDDEYVVKRFPRTSSIIMEAGLEPLDIKYIDKLSLSKNPKNAFIIRLGYAFTPSLRSNFWINTYLSAGIVNKLKFKNKITEFKNPLFMSFNTNISKRFYLGSSNIYIAPLVGTGISLLYARNKDLAIELSMANYYYFIGSEIAYKINSSDDISFWIYNSISYKSKIEDGVTYVEPDPSSAKYKPYMNDGVSYGVSYKYYFSP